MSFCEVKGVGNTKQQVSWTDRAAQEGGVQLLLYWSSLVNRRQILIPTTTTKAKEIGW